MEARFLTEYDVELRYNFNVGTSILVKEGEKVYPGDLLAKFSMAQLKSKRYYRWFADGLTAV